VAPGLTPAALEVALGPPEATGGQSRKQRRPLIWKYGDVEFHFRAEGPLWLIHLDRFSAADRRPQGWGGLHVEPWIVHQGMAQEAFLTAAREIGLRYTVRPEPQYNQEVVVLGSGVEAGFISQPEPCSSPIGLAWLSRRQEAAERCGRA
jgi:hypothetical protein